MTAAEAPSKGASILASLTAEVMEQKKKAAKELTPVAGEARPTALPKTSQPFPNDMPVEVVALKAGELTRIITHLTEARDALLTLVEAPLPNEAVDEAAEQKAREKAGDEKAKLADFNAAFKAKQEAAQADVFAQVEEDVASVTVPNVAETPPPEGWACPVHNKRTEKTSNKTGKTYIGCPDCNLFER